MADEPSAAASPALLLKSCSGSAGLGQVLEFMYTAKLSLSCQNVEDVVAVANFLQMQEVVNACSAYQSVTASAPALVADFSSGGFCCRSPPETDWNRL